LIISIILFIILPIIGFIVLVSTLAQSSSSPSAAVMVSAIVPTFGGAFASIFLFTFFGMLLHVYTYTQGIANLMIFVKIIVQRKNGCSSARAEYTSKTARHAVELSSTNIL